LIMLAASMLLPAGAMPAGAMAAEETCASNSAQFCQSLLQTHATFVAGSAKHNPLLFQEAANNKDQATNRAELVQCVASYADGLDAVRPELGAPIRTHRLQATRTSDRSIVFGAGLSFTGTRSLSAFMMDLNMTGCHFKSSWASRLDHIMGLENPLFGIPEVYGVYNFTEAKACYMKLRSMDLTEGIGPDIDFMTDAPIPQLALDLFLAYPNAKFVLSTRPASDWVDVGFATPLAPLQEPCGINSSKFEPSEMARLVDLNNDLIRCIVPQSQLFELSVFSDPPEVKAHLSRSLSAFLGRPLPVDVPFPHINNGDPPFDKQYTPLSPKCSEA